MPAKAELSVVADTKYKIEKGIPIPRKGVNRPLSVWARMEIGDSVLVTGRAQKNAAALAKRDGKKFTTRTVDGGTRVWRVS